MRGLFRGCWWMGCITGHRRPGPRWPRIPGQSIHRTQASAYGNEATHWLTGDQTPGRDRTSGGIDTDGDGLEDAWEIRHFGSLARDGSGDADTDGMDRDRAEYGAGTKVRGCDRSLELALLRYAGVPTLGFRGVQAKRYQVQYTDSAGSGVWLTLKEAGPAGEFRNGHRGRHHGGSGNCDTFLSSGTESGA